MSERKEVVYSVPEEKLGRPTLFVDGSQDIEKAIDVLSEYTKIEKEKITFFITNYGFKEFLEGSDIFGLTEEQKEKLQEVKYLIEIGE